MRKLLSNRLLVGLLCFTLFFKMVVPVGYMPDFNALQQGVYKLRICTGFVAQNILVDQGQKPINSSQQDSGHKTEKSNNSMCPFAGALASGLAVTWFALTLLLLWRPIRYITQISNIDSVTVISAWPRGPPLILA